MSDDRSPRRRPPELLAPAGDAESLRAAVAAGADAVYFGLEEFNARRRAANFSTADLPDVVADLHRHNVRAHVALNTLIFPSEVPRAAQCLAAIARAGADAVIVQDLGIARLAHRLAPSLSIHASTQMTLTEPRAVALVRRLGVRRAILARELSLADVTLIARALPDVELELFVHGALCISYSGQCLASCLLFDRSANRGLCAQPCRLPYRLIVDGRDATPTDVTTPLSPHDLATWDLVPQLVSAGASALKIEGRLKGPHYVAAAVRLYRRAIDAASSGRPFSPTADELADLAQGFSRGFTHGFLDAPDHARLVRGDVSGHRGVRVATVLAADRRAVTVELASGAALKPGDGVVFSTPGERDEPEGGRIYAVDPASPPHAAKSGRRVPPARSVVRLAFGRGDVDTLAVRAGAEVWKTDDPKLRRRLETTWSRDLVPRPASLSIEVRAAAAQPLVVRASDDLGHTVEVASSEPVEAARRHPLDESLIREQFGRLGGTPFALTAVTLRGPTDASPPDPVMAPKSVLNDLRRRAVDDLLHLRQRGSLHEIVDPAALDSLRADIARRAAEQADRDSIARLSVLVRSPDQAAAVAQWHSARAAAGQGTSPLDLVYVDFGDAPLDHAPQGIRAAGLRLGLATPRIIKPGDDSLFAAMLDVVPQVDAVLVRNLGSRDCLRRHRATQELVGDYSLNAANELTADLLASWGLDRVTASYDLAPPELQRLAAAGVAPLLEVVAYRHTPMFHIEHCLWSADFAAGRPRPQCGRLCRQRILALEDRNGEQHPVRADAACRATVYSARPQSAERDMPALCAAGIRRFRIELLDEPPAHIAALLDAFAASMV